jgi:transcription elongation factor Elf1
MHICPSCTLRTARSHVTEQRKKQIQNLTCDNCGYEYERDIEEDTYGVYQ